MIVLEAATVNVTGTCYANGGGGGEGANTAADGNDGLESAGPNLAGAGGQGGTMFGGDGGDSAFGRTLGGAAGGIGDSTGAAIGGGGGGGGGAGIIKVIATTKIGTNDSARVAPPPS
jgi:fibronectin-binding autotransporter adhesin